MNATIILIIASYKHQTTCTNPLYSHFNNVSILPSQDNKRNFTLKKDHYILLTDLDSIFCVYFPTSYAVHHREWGGGGRVL